jgi:hypothetical protein
VTSAEGGRGPTAGRGPSVADAVFIGALVAARLAIDAWVLHAGFSHVSDDDYARTVIAEQFAHAPCLDPSGTSWLPFPFWITGAAMAVLGRTLEAARAVAVVLGAVAVAAPYAAMRAAGVSPRASFAACAVAVALPWNAWLGVATVPDGWTGALLAAGAIAMSAPRARPWAAAALAMAALSRYEAWPACAAFVVACVSARRMERWSRRDVLAAAIAVAGPLLWMAWNAHAHGSPFHFVARVTAFRRAVGAAAVPWLDKLSAYPLALVSETPEAAGLGVAGAAGMVMFPEIRRRWAWPAATAMAVLAFLVAGDLGDGAPTHHPARALGSLWWILLGLGADALAVAFADLGARGIRIGIALLGACATVAWAASLGGRWARSPGSSEWERRDAQVAEGLSLRARGVSSVEITPCQFEHFALLAAWGAPERASVRPRTQAPVGPGCPAITEP